MKNKAILEVKDLEVYFPIKKGLLKKKVGEVKAVDGLSFTLKRGETLGLVGESGCGKTTTGKAIVKLIDATGGEVYYDGKEILNMNPRKFKDIRPKLQMIFQDPFSSLNPRMTVADIIAEPIKFHRPKENIQELVEHYLELTGLKKEQLSRYPHEFSGGQRQRIGIARALALNPEVIIADEPVSALDVSIQAKIINLMKRLQEELGIAYLFIAHDLSIVKHISDYIAVMYLGNIVELSPAKELYQNPAHPYTKALISSIPIPDPRKKKDEIILKGEIPSPLDAPKGCKFATRCPYATAKCNNQRPKMEVISNNHQVACHHWKKINS